MSTWLSVDMLVVSVRRQRLRKERTSIVCIKRRQGSLITMSSTCVLNSWVRYQSSSSALSLAILGLLPFRHNLEREIHMFGALVDTTRRNHIHIITNIITHIVFGQATANLDQRSPGTTAVFLFQASRSLLHLFWCKVVQHDHIGTCVACLLCFVQRLAFHFHLDGEASSGLCGGDGSGDVVVAGPDVVVFEHCHGGQILTVGVAAANDHAVFLDKTETRSGLSSAGKGVFVAGVAEEGRRGSDHIQGHSLAEQKVPCRSCDSGYMLFSILAYKVAFLDQPLHFTLQLLEDLVYKRYTGENTWGLGEQAGSTDDAGPRGWQQMCWVAVGGCSRGDWHVWQKRPSLVVSIQSCLIDLAARREDYLPSYLGGTLLHRLKLAELPTYNALYALVRTDSQAQAVKQYGAEPLKFDSYNAEAVEEAVLKYEINIVFLLHDAIKSGARVNFIKALSSLKEKNGTEVHLLHVSLEKIASSNNDIDDLKTSGAKSISSHVNAPVNEPFSDLGQTIYEIQKHTDPGSSILSQLVETNNTVTELSESLAIRSYVVMPCIVYGKGEGFGNQISIQTPAIVNAAKAAKKVYRVDSDRPVWPVCHVGDNANLYIQILRNILSGKEQGYGKEGYYLASPGSMAWDDIYANMAKRLYECGIVTDPQVQTADDAALEKMGAGLNCGKPLVALQLGGKCMLTAEHGKKIGWQPQYPAEHILDALEEEVDLILKHKGRD
ncbi:NAD(P)-binding protein, partial [Aureobasidium melanogenum]